MKSSNLLMILSLQLIIYLGCKKDTHNIAANTSSIVLNNTAPTAYAGQDLKIELPTNEAPLTGSYFDIENNVKKVEWTKLSGPDSSLIDNNSAIHTKVIGLKEGIYRFELTVTDAMGLHGKDTMIITVAKRPGTPPNNTPNTPGVIFGTREITFTGLQWTFPWYPALEIKNIYSYASPTKVFIQRANIPGWVEVLSFSTWPNYNNVPYEYFIETRPDGAGMYHFGSLYVFFYEYYAPGTGVSDSPSVKIAY